ncbi:hypothetical protein [Kitasatospora purpeofusca]|uniref:hypothetical protein n=1 Tax=Kitasatospora purpeofusca TaxID=67352 RepID=UPI0036B8F358
MDAGTSLGLNSGVDPTAGARRAGHSVAVMLRAYARHLHGAVEYANELISKRLTGTTRRRLRRILVRSWSVLAGQQRDPGGTR